MFCGKHVHVTSWFQHTTEATFGLSNWHVPRITKATTPENQIQNGRNKIFKIHPPNCYQDKKLQIQRPTHYTLTIRKYHDKIHALCF